MRFESDYPEAEVILLEQNYRSTQTILDVAMSVIDRNPHRTKKQLFTERGEGRRVIVHELYDDREQADYVAETIANLVATKKANLNDFAVMYRTNAQSRLLEEAFLSANIPYKLVGAQRFYGRREVKDIIAYLRLIANPEDSFSLTRIIGTPPRGIGSKTYAQLRTQAQQLEISPGTLLLELADPDSEYHQRFSNRADRVLSSFGELFKGWREVYEGIPPVEIIDRVLEDVDYRSYLEDGTDEGRDRWENVMELRRLAAEFQTTGLLEFLERVALVSDQDTLEEDVQAPTLLTLHAAKGLEFRRVFIVGLNDGVLPHRRSFEEPEEMQEERRLFYVGITRAMDQLYLSHALNQYTYGYPEPSEPSRYYHDIPPDLREEGGDRRLGEYGTRQDPESARWDDHQMDKARQEPLEKQYRPGLRVEHPAWGEGMVLNSKIQDEDEVVDVFFDKEGLKKLIASLADLTILD
jgi:DNA helicase-2/ATP-dependent DNA helicase PcrA